MSRRQDLSNTQTWRVPEYINGIFTNRVVVTVVPNCCTQCGGKRSTLTAVYNQKYGSLVKAYCMAGCGETYEDVYKQAVAYKNTTHNTPSNKAAQDAAFSFFKSKMEPWQPDTRVGSVPNDQNCGMNCANKKCTNGFIQYAAPNQPDGKTFVCRSCREYGYKTS